MILSDRLSMSAALVTCGGTAADVGCDHAHTCIYLLEKGKAEHCIAMDLRTGPLAKARENLAACGCLDRTELRLSYGLDELKPYEADTIIIAGMGGLLTGDILERGLETALSASELILQPQSHIYEVRCFLEEHGFVIADEDMCFEDGKFYTAIRAVPGGRACRDSEADRPEAGSESCRDAEPASRAAAGQSGRDGKTDDRAAGCTCSLSRAELEFGPVLLAKKHPVLRDYLETEERKTVYRLEQIDRSSKEEAEGRRSYFTERLGLVREALHGLG